MLEKLFLLVEIVIDGFLAIFIAAIFYLLLALVFMFAMIPISAIVGDEVANKITNFAGRDFGYGIIYAIVFISMVMDDLGVPNFKTTCKRWLKKKTGTS